MPEIGYYVLVKRSDDDTEVRRMGPMTEHKASKVESGLDINLNHETYYTEVVKANPIEIDDE